MITLEAVEKVMELTGVDYYAAKDALIKTNGDVDAAVKLIQPDTKDIGEDISVKFTDKTTAEVSCDFFYKGDDFGWSVRDARVLDATLRKDRESGRWRFARARLSNILEK